MRKLHADAHRCARCGICRIGDTWSNERVVIFTEYADTLDWLAEVLRAQGYGPVLGTIQGSTSTEQRERTRQQFSADPSVEPVRVLVATKPVDFRKGAEGLAALVREELGADPFGGAVFVFRAKRADRIKLLWWDCTALCKRGQ